MTRLPERFPHNQAVLTAACEPEMAVGAVVVMPR
jgi:hypothetical protein